MDIARDPKEYKGREKKEPASDRDQPRRKYTAIGTSVASQEPARDHEYSGARPEEHHTAARIIKRRAMPWRNDESRRSGHQADRTDEQQNSEHRSEQPDEGLNFGIGLDIRHGV